MAEHKTLLIRCIAVLFISCLGLGIHYLKPTNDITVIEPKIETVAKTPTTQTITVHVTGAVQVPGVYQLTVPVRLIDAIKKAGGPTEKANLDAINLASHLKDAEKVHVPYQEHVKTNTHINTRISINTATVEALTTLHGIGPKTAQRIVQHRAQHGRFNAINDLKNVKGIGPKHITKLRPFIRL